MEYKSPTQLVVDSSIVEYDIRHANVSLMRYYGICPEGEDLDKLDKMKKIDREIHVGLLQRKDKDFSKRLLKSFDDIMNEFLTANDLKLDDDILAIKKDAAFVVNKPVKITDFGCVHFVKKNQYVHFIRIGQYECYIKKDNTFDVKGIGDRDAIELHQKGILGFILDIIELYKSNSRKALYNYLHDYAEAYKKRELEFPHYREFNPQSGYRYIEGDNEIFLDDIDESVIDSIDIGYNYFNIILPVIRLMM